MTDPVEMLIGEDAFMEPLVVGAFSWKLDEDPTRRSLCVVLPRVGYIEIPVVDGSPCRHEWLWDGDVERPTIRPSVKSETRNAKGDVSWHGFITDGRLEECGS